MASQPKRVGADGRTTNTANIGSNTNSAVAAEIRHPTPKPETPPPVATDAEGHPIPAEAKKISALFARRNEVISLMTKISSLKGQVLKLAETDPLFARLSTSDFQVAMDRARSALKNAAPHSICPYCRADGCKACHKAGWVTIGVWEAAPADMKGAIA
jgi:NADH pyrophosphatase NudC (nudix superfamily)